MEKEQLLATLDTDVRYGQVALALAKRVSTAADVQAEAARWAQKRARASSGRYWSGAFALLCLATFVICLVIARPGYWALFSFIGFPLAILVAFFCEQTRAQLNRELSLLQPIAGSSACLTALELLELDDENVLAWRDRALAERDVLYGFDVRIMQLVMAQSKELKEKAVRQARIDEACRKVHGLPVVVNA